MLNRNSKLKEVYATAIGRDILDKFMQRLKLPEGSINNPLIANLRIAALKRILGDKLDDGFINTFLRLLNSEEVIPASGDCALHPAWWKEAVFYQIYPRSFCDANGDGMGDME